MRTLVILKPDVLSKLDGGWIGEIISRFESGATVTALTMGQYPPKFWEDFYEEHVERPMFKSLVKFMASGPVVAMVLDSTDEEQDVISFARKLAVDKIRPMFSGDPPCWAIHASESGLAAYREISFFFSKSQIRSVR